MYLLMYLNYLTYVPTYVFKSTSRSNADECISKNIIIDVCISKNIYVSASRNRPTRRRTATPYNQVDQITLW